MRWLRGALIADPAIILSTIVFGSVSVIVSFFDGTGRAQAAVARSWARFLLLASGVEVTVEGLQSIDPNRSYIFLSNHTSYMDTPVVLANISAQFRFLAKRGLFQIPFLELPSQPRLPYSRSTSEDPRAAVRTPQMAAEIRSTEENLFADFPGRRPLSRGRARLVQRRGRVYRHSRWRSRRASGSHRRHPRSPLRRRRCAVRQNRHARAAPD